MGNFFRKLITLPQERRVFGLDLLRALAILGVLLTHGQSVYPPEQRGWFGFFANISGILGVELFFVLSGFLIGSILLSLEPRFQQIKTLPFFWQRRWFRTIPNYLLFLILNIAVSLAFQKSVPSFIPYLTFSQNWLWPHPGFFVEAWSLAVEEWFYLLFPMSLYLLNKAFKSFKAAFILSTGFFILIPSLIRINWALTGLADWDENFRKIMLIRLDAIMYGVLAAWIKKTIPQIWRRQNFLFFGAGVLTLYISWSYAVSENLDTNFFAKTFLFSNTSIGFAFLLPIFDQWENVNKNIFSTAFQLIAVWSYSLYLCNLQVLQVINFINEFFRTTSFTIQTLFLFIFFTTSLIISSAIYTYFEKPLTNLRNYFSKS
jgi:peptidoglycan/LPS O-acetylase OafA/YrhL